MASRFALPLGFGLTRLLGFGLRDSPARREVASGVRGEKEVDGFFPKTNKTSKFKKLLKKINLNLSKNVNLNHH